MGITEKKYKKAGKKNAILSIRADILSIRAEITTLVFFFLLFGLSSGAAQFSPFCVLA